MCKKCFQVHHSPLRGCIIKLRCIFRLNFEDSDEQGDLNQTVSTESPPADISGHNWKILYWQFNPRDQVYGALPWDEENNKRAPGQATVLIWCQNWGLLVRMELSQDAT